MMYSFLIGSLVIWFLVSILWIWSVWLKNVSIIDLFWGMGFVIVNACYFLLSDISNVRSILLLLLVTIWGIRLSLHLAIRNIGKGEDFRYQEFRRNYGENRYWWFSYFQTFLLQGVLIMLVSLPLFGINYGENTQIYWMDYIALIIWCIGFIFEAGGDYQLTKFKKKHKSKGEVLQTGFWKYTRHPNYFGDAAIWWSYALFSIAAGSYWQIIGSVIMTILLIKISGVSLLEKSLQETKPNYKDYIDRTSSFFPWFPKK